MHVTNHWLRGEKRAKDSFIGVPVLLFSLSSLFPLHFLLFVTVFTVQLGTNSNSLHSFVFHCSSLILRTHFWFSHTQTSLQTKRDLPVFCFCSSRSILLNFVSKLPHILSPSHYFVHSGSLLQTALFSHCTLFLFLFLLRSPIIWSSFHKQILWYIHMTLLFLSYSIPINSSSYPFSLLHHFFFPP